MKELRNLTIENRSKNEELEQYNRYFYLCIDGIPAVSNESSDDVMNFTKLLYKETKISVLENVLNCVNWTGPTYTDRVSNKNCKTIIVSFTNFHHKTLCYRTKRNQKSVEVNLYLAKSRFHLFKKVNYHLL